MISAPNAKFTPLPLSSWNNFIKSVSSQEHAGQVVWLSTCIQELSWFRTRPGVILAFSWFPTAPPRKYRDGNRSSHDLILWNTSEFFSYQLFFHSVVCSELLRLSSNKTRNLNRPPSFSKLKLSGEWIQLSEQLILSPFLSDNNPLLQIKPWNSWCIFLPLTLEFFPPSNPWIHTVKMSPTENSFCSLRKYTVFSPCVCSSETLYCLAHQTLLLRSLSCGVYC
jgi:hypothetical protein